MKPVLFFSFLLIIVVAANAQLKTDTSGLKKPVVTNIRMPVKPNTQLPVKIVGGIQRSTSGISQESTPENTPSKPPTTPTTPTTGAQHNSTPPPNVTGSPAQVKTDADYYLSVVKLTIKTGRDNKEYPSEISVAVCPGSQTIDFNKAIPNSHGFRLRQYKNELSVNTTQDLFIEKESRYSAAENSLTAYKQYGLKFWLFYYDKSILNTGAWKIESLSLTLQFKDAAGNPHPTMGSKTIIFPDWDLWMDAFDKVHTYYRTDGYFNPLPVKQFNLQGFVE